MGTGRQLNLVTGPHFPFIALRDGGPPASHWAGCSRSKRESKAELAVETTGGDQPNILPLDLILILSTLYLSFTSLHIPSQINA